MKPIVDTESKTVSFDGGNKWTSYIESNQLNINSAINALDELQREISIRKVEISQICHQEKISKPSFADLDWMFERIHYIKKTI